MGSIFKITENIGELILNITRGHPSSVATTLDFLLKVFRNEESKYTSVFDSLYKIDYYNALGSTKGMPQKFSINQDD